MRVRTGILALLLVASLSACGDDKKDTNTTSSEPTAEVSETPTSLDPGDVDPARCAKFLEGQAKASELSAQLRPGNDVEDAIEAAKAQFDALKEGAPQDIQDALDAVKDAYTALGEFYKDPTAMTGENAQKIADANKKLGENAIKLNNWIIQNCS